MKHPNAELMAQYAQDAMETDTPWERWECCWDGKTVWRNLEEHPCWCKTIQYRRKPKQYEPTLLDQALQLEIYALRLRINHYANTPEIVEVYREVLDALKAKRSPAMIEHLRQRGEL